MRPKGFFTDRQGSLKKRQGFGIVAHGVVNFRKIVKTFFSNGMLESEGFFPNRLHTLKKR
jgi:hypothetical protein